MNILSTVTSGHTQLMQKMHAEHLDTKYENAYLHNMITTNCHNLRGSQHFSPFKLLTI